MFWLQTPPHLALTSAPRVCAPVLSVSKHKSIVASLTIAPDEPTLYSAFLWMLLQPVISLFTSWTAHTQTGRQRARLLRSVWGQKARQRAALSKRQQRPPCLWLQREERSPNNWDKAVVTPPPPPVHLSSGHQSLRLPFAMRKSTRSSRMLRPLSYPPPTLVTTFSWKWTYLPLSSEHSEVAFGEPRSHYCHIMWDQQTDSILWCPEPRQHRRSCLETFQHIPWNFEIKSVLFSLEWCNENGLCAHA